MDDDVHDEIHDDDDDDDDERKMMKWTQEKDDDVEEEDVEEEDRSQSRDTRFVRACAIETHMDISQEPFVEIYRELAGHG